jgi:hypothetical protein
VEHLHTRPPVLTWARQPHTSHSGNPKILGVKYG